MNYDNAGELDPYWTAETIAAQMADMDRGLTILAACPLRPVDR